MIIAIGLATAPPLIQVVPPPAVSLTASDWIALANAFFAFLAAAAAAVATLAARKAIQLEQAARQAEKRDRYFTKLIADVAVLEVPAFIDSVTRLVGEARREIAALDAATVAQSVFTDRARRLVNEFNELFFNLNERLRNATLAWGDRALTNDVARELQELQDAITPKLAQLAIPNEQPREILSRLNELSARVLSVIIRHGMREEAGTSLNPGEQK